ncbi:hypothetical protein Glove_109g419 [Diversispora epigaea]|uniref:Uncharacterized protein n=1 Tax=Diversispora epigaea TaxID=1348612 RepID=A0A397J4L6_9GLOM|nr:hypothetical protein Glove_109g419 [Diversispora epigaea]
MKLIYALLRNQEDKKELKLFVQLVMELIIGSIQATQTLQLYQSELIQKFSDRTKANLKNMTSVSKEIAILKDGYLVVKK